MPFNGSGTFQRVYNWTTDKNNSIDITASRVDTEDTGFATGLSNCICRDGQSTITANLPMSGFAHTGVGLATLATQYPRVDQVQKSSFTWIAGGGTADAITGTYSPAITALTDGIILNFRATAANATTTPTFAPNGLTAHTITKKGGSALLVGDITAALAEYTLIYNLANTRWELSNPDINSGTSANQLVRLNGSAQLPAVDGSLLTGITVTPPGAALYYGGSSAPTGWLLCYGQAVSRTTYAALFAIVSTGFGIGDGSTTFNMPDCRGRGMAGLDNMGGSAASRLTGTTMSPNATTMGANGGAETHTLTTAEIPPPTFTISSGNVANGSNNAIASADPTISPKNISGITTNYGGGAHAIVQPTILFNVIMKT